MENTPSTTCAEGSAKPGKKPSWPPLERARVGVERLVAHCGGDPKRAAKLAEASPASLYRWRSRWPGGGMGGKIPFSRIPKILANAKQQGVVLSLSDLTDEVS